MTTHKQSPKPELSPPAQAALGRYEQYLRHEVDLQPATIRNYLSDLQQFMAWCERTEALDGEEHRAFSLQGITTPTLTRYRDYLQKALNRQPATINRYLVSLKRYFAWALETELVARDPARVVKPVGQASRPPRHLSDAEESALVAAVEAGGSLRDRTLLVLMLHTGLRVSEVCQVKRGDVVLTPHRGRVQVWGKRNKSREVPLNSTARKVMMDYLESLPAEQAFLFLSRRTH